jgi:hypothetical protein
MAWQRPVGGRASPVAWRQLLAAVLLAAALAARGAAAQARAAAPDAAILVAEDGEALGRALATLSQPGPPAVIRLAANISMTDVPSPRPLLIARNTTIEGVGLPAGTELNLHNDYNAWQVAPGVQLTIRNMTLSNLAERPPSAQPPPALNVSVFAFPLWFFQTNRRGRQRRRRAAAALHAAAAALHAAHGPRMCARAQRPLDPNPTSNPVPALPQGRGAARAAGRQTGDPL